MGSVAASTLGLALSGSLAALVAGHPAHAQPACAPGAPPLVIYHAGSLSTEFKAVEQLFKTQTGACITDVAAGSLDAARQVTAGRQPADIFAAADYLDIDFLLKPVRYVNYTIVFAKGSLVLAYTPHSRYSGTIAAAGVAFNPPGLVPDAAANWYDQLVEPGVVIGSTNPFLDPTGYRTDIMFQLAARSANMPALYNSLLDHLAIIRPADVLGTTLDYQVIYETSAYAAYRADPGNYRYVRLPPAVNLSSPAHETAYQAVSTVVPGLGIAGAASHVAIPGTRAAWGLTILQNAPHPATAVQFLQLLFSPQGIAIQATSGPTPIVPPVVSATDYENLPAALKPLVAIRW